MAAVKRKFTNFSIEEILKDKKIKLEDEDCFIVKQETPEYPSSSTCDTSFDKLATISVQPFSCQSPAILTSQFVPDLNTSALSSRQFPTWTQCQKDTRKSRRPYSRHTVSILSWWFHHLPFLTVEEMEMVAMLSSLSRQQVKVWWQNRRHSQRGRQAGEADPYTSHIHHLPTYDGVLGQVPEPGTGSRAVVFQDILTFFYARVLPSTMFY